MKEKLFRKIRETAAFTLSETLLTVLIMSIILTAVGGGVTVMRNNYIDVVMRAQAQTLLATAVSAVTGDLESATMVKMVKNSESDVSYFYSGRRNMYMKYSPVNNNIKSGPARPDESIEIRALKSDGSQLKDSDGNEIIFPLLSEATGKKQNLETMISDIEIVKDGDNIKYFIVTIGVYCTSSAFDRVLEARTIKVRPYNKIKPS